MFLPFYFNINENRLLGPGAGMTFTLLASPCTTLLLKQYLLSLLL